MLPPFCTKTWCRHDLPPATCRMPRDPGLAWPDLLERCGLQGAGRACDLAPKVRHLNMTSSHQLPGVSRPPARICATQIPLEQVFSPTCTTNHSPPCLHRDLPRAEDAAATKLWPTEIYPQTEAAHAARKQTPENDPSPSGKPRQTLPASSHELPRFYKLAWGVKGWRSTWPVCRVERG